MGAVHGGRLRRLLGVAVLMMATAGCVASQQSSTDAVGASSDAVAQASSAVETASLTVELLDERRLTGPVADAALLDQLGVLDEASRALTTLVPPDSPSASARTSALDAVAVGQVAVVDARAWAARTAGGDLRDTDAVPATAGEALDRLDEAAAALETADPEVAG